MGQFKQVKFKLDYCSSIGHIQLHSDRFGPVFNITNKNNLRIFFSEFGT